MDRQRTKDCLNDMKMSASSLYWSYIEASDELEAGERGGMKEDAMGVYHAEEYPRYRRT